MGCVMKKLLFSFVLFCLFIFNSYCLQFDILGAVSYRYVNTSGDTSLKANNSAASYNAVFNVSGINWGLDLFFTDKIGLYFRVGTYSVDSVTHTINNNSFEAKGSGFNYSMSSDIGAVFAFPINNYFSVCAAPAVSINYCDFSFYDYKKSHATLDSLLSYGFSGDLYLKFRYKHFLAAAGCSGSFFPWCELTSSDTDINYYSFIKNSTAYIIKPYIGAGVSF